MFRFPIRPLPILCLLTFLVLPFAPLSGGESKEKDKKDPLAPVLESVYFEGETLEAACAVLAREFQELDPEGREMVFVFQKGVDRNVVLTYVRLDQLSFRDLFKKLEEEKIFPKWSVRDGKTVTVTFYPKAKAAAK